MARNFLQKLKRTNIPNSYYVVILLAVISVAAVSYGVAISSQKKQLDAEDNTSAQTRVTSLLSRKVNDLNLGMSRREVIRKMGIPDWVAVWGDEGLLAPPDPNIALELRWKNPECREILVMFSPEDEVIGWDDGAEYCKSGLPMKGREQYTCTQPDRAQYCR